MEHVICHVGKLFCRFLAVAAYPGTNESRTAEDHEIILILKIHVAPASQKLGPYFKTTFPKNGIEFMQEIHISVRAKQDPAHIPVLGNKGEKAERARRDRHFRRRAGNEGFA